MYLDSQSKWWSSKGSAIWSTVLKVSLSKVDLELKVFWQQFTFQIFFADLDPLAEMLLFTGELHIFMQSINFSLVGTPTFKKILPDGFIFILQPWDKTLNYFNLGTGLLRS